jgi:hypothetical protein
MYGWRATLVLMWGQHVISTDATLHPVLMWGH